MILPEPEKKLADLGAKQNPGNKKNTSVHLPSCYQVGDTGCVIALTRLPWVREKTAVHQFSWIR